MHASDSLPQVKGHTVSFVKLADEPANLSSHNPFERLALGGYHIYEDPAGAE